MGKENMTMFAERLGEAMRERGLSQRALAAEVGCSQPLISHYVNGREMPAHDMLARLCEVLGVDANYLYGMD